MTSLATSILDPVYSAVSDIRNHSTRMLQSLTNLCYVPKRYPSIHRVSKCHILPDYLIPVVSSSFTNLALHYETRAYLRNSFRKPNIDCLPVLTTSSPFASTAAPPKIAETANHVNFHHITTCTSLTRQHAHAFTLARPLEGAEKGRRRW